jgi:hypothetical protein
VGLGFPGNIPFNAGITQLLSGLHLLNFRAQDASGRWSDTAILPLQVQDATSLAASPANFPITDSNNWLVAAEYFWDTDPGTNNGAPVTFSPGESFTPSSGTAAAFSVSVPHLSLGLHFLKMRVKTAGGVWTATEQTPFILDRQTQLALVNSIVSIQTSTNVFTTNIATIFCGGVGQLCAATFDLPVQTASLLTVQYTASPQNCADVSMHFLVDGAPRGVSGELAPGSASGFFELGPVSPPGGHLLQLQAEGFLGGCDSGTLTSWSGTLEIHTTALSTNLAGGALTHGGGLGAGIALADYDTNGYPDVLATYQDQSSSLFRNTNGLTFDRPPTLPSAGPAGGQTAVWADYDNDGLLDLFVTTRDRGVSDRNLLYHNLGGGNFQLMDATNLPSAESNSVGCAWADVDNDGLVDLAVASRTTGQISLYHNNGDGTFTDISMTASLICGSAECVAFGDFNNDGLPDLVTAGSGGVHIFQNLGTNHFLELTNTGLASDPTAQSVTWGDYDNDGYLDLFVSSSAHLGALFHNNHNKTFTQTQISTFNQPGYSAAACSWADVDQDGLLDLFVTSRATNNPNLLFHHNADGTFTVATNGPAAPPGIYAGAAWADLDTNGTPDLVVASVGGTNLLYQNAGSGANWLQVKLSGRPSNRAAIGAKVHVLANIDGQSFWQMREISGGNGSGSQNELPANFGLGDATLVDSLKIEWPSGLTTAYSNVQPNRVLYLAELPEGTPVVEINRNFNPSGQYYFVSLDPVTVTIDSPFLDGYVFYTVDGSPPDFTANWYTAPFQVSPPAVITPIAYDSLFFQEVVGPAAQIILVPTFYVTNSTPGGGDFTLSPPGPNYLSNTLVTAVATNLPGWTFLGWGGDLSGTNSTITFPMDSHMNIAAIFGTPLTATVLGGTNFGSLSVDPVTNRYPFGSIPRLSVVPAPGKYFVSWGLSGTNINSLTNNPLDWPMTVSAPSFIARLASLPTNTFSLTTLVSGNGSVNRSTYASYYASGTSVTLTAVENGGQHFLGWSGDASGTQNPLPVLMDSSKVITASFAIVPPLFTFSSATYQANETDAAVSLTVLNNGVAGNVSFSTSDGTALGGSGTYGDYLTTQRSLSFTNGELARSVLVPLRDNFLSGQDRNFQVLLSNATGGSGSLGSNSTATVFIHETDQIYTNGSLLVQVLPGPPPDTNAGLQVTLVPPEATGQWRFAWELGWRDSGQTVTHLAADPNGSAYDLQFRSEPGYLPFPAARTVVVTNGGIIPLSSSYYPTLASSLGSLTLDFGNTYPPGAGWRFRGETSARAPGSTASGLLPDIYFVQFETVSGYRAPSAQQVPVSGNVTWPAGTYVPVLAPSNSLPAALPGFASITYGLTNNPRLPYAFAGQLVSPLNGFGSGAAVRSNVVLTAAHVVFDYQSLSFVGPVYWFFQNQAGEYNPLPLAARGAYPLSGYAAARLVDRDTNHLSAAQSSAQSRNQDVAALYFLSAVARGGFGGYLASDAPTNQWLGGSSQKMLVGYPVDASDYGYTNISPGKMHVTPAANYNFTLQNGRVYSSPDFLGFSGNSGGPLCVTHTNGVVYPAAVYLGTLSDGSSAVRSIDSDVVDLISQAALLGDLGTNNTGGGVITFVPNQALSSNNPAYVQVILGPTAALQAGAAWKLNGDPDSDYASAANFTRSITTNGAGIVFKTLNGWLSPTNQIIHVTAGALNVISNAFYTPATQPVQFSGVRLLPNGAIALTLSGVTGQVYTILIGTNLLLPVTNWATLFQVTNSSGQTTFTDQPPVSARQRFYRARPAP